MVATKYSARWRLRIYLIQEYYELIVWIRINE